MAYLMTATELANKGIAIYNDRKNWTYVQGALGQLGESDRVRGLYKYFWGQPNHANNSMTMPYDAWLAEYGKGKHCTDCSNFINYLLGYTFSMYSTRGFAQMQRFEGDKKDAPPGTVLCMDGHVGLCIGNNEFIDFYKYNETCRKGKVSESLFNYAVYVPNVNYSSQSSPKTMSVVVRDKTRYVGDSLTTDDFVVTITLEDGNQLVNPTGWGYTPIVLSNTVNVIAVVYETLVSYVVVDAIPKGTFYCVQIPAKSKEDAITMQRQLTIEGYPNPAVVEL